MYESVQVHIILCYGICRGQHIEVTGSLKMPHCSDIFQIQKRTVDTITRVVGPRKNVSDMKVLKFISVGPYIHFTPCDFELQVHRWYIIDMIINMIIILHIKNDWLLFINEKQHDKVNRLTFTLLLYGQVFFNSS